MTSEAKRQTAPKRTDSWRTEMLGEDAMSDGTKRKRPVEHFTHLGCRGDISALDAEGKSLLFRAGDLRARFVLNDLTRAVYVPYSHPECQATATLIHAERYLSDRLAYELAPWPKGMVKDETITPLPDRCPLCDRIIIEPNTCGECGQKFCSLNCTLDHEHAKAEKPQ